MKSIKKNHAKSPKRFIIPNNRARDSSSIIDDISMLKKLPDAAPKWLKNAFQNPKKGRMLPERKININNKIVRFLLLLKNNPKIIPVRKIIRI